MLVRKVQETRHEFCDLSVLKNILECVFMLLPSLVDRSEYTSRFLIRTGYCYLFICLWKNMLLPCVARLPCEAWTQPTTCILLSHFSLYSFPVCLVYTGTGQRRILGVPLYCSPFKARQGLSLNLELHWWPESHTDPPNSAQG